jgi:hypothetical protein
MRLASKATVPVTVTTGSKLLFSAVAKVTSARLA